MQWQPWNKNSYGEYVIIMRVFFLFIALFFLISCKSNQVITPIESKPQVVSFVELNSGTNGGFPEKSHKVITDQTTFNIMWEAAFERFSDPQKPPRIDFENKMIVLVTMGIQNSGGYSIKVSTGIETDSDITLTVLETKPGASCATSDVMTFPYQIIELKKSKKEVIFKTTNKVFDCEE